MGATLPAVPRASRRLLTSAATLACVALKLSGSVHYVLVQHTRCEEHGELSHATGHAQAHTATLEAPAHTVSFAEDHTPDDADHEHCLVTNRHRASASVRPVAVLEASVAPRDPWHRIPIAPRPISALRQAPKTSPPA